MANPRPVPRPENLRPPWKKGESGNPSGISKEQNRIIQENVGRALRIRGAILHAIEDRFEYLLETEGPEAANAYARSKVDSDTLRLLKDTEHRGLGAPTTKLELSGREGLPVEMINGSMDARRAAEVYSATLNDQKED